MNQILADRPAESGHHNSCHDQRKKEVEVAIHQAIPANDL
jgi:hypothetical protein